jgi:hypothetical protein
MEDKHMVSTNFHFFIILGLVVLGAGQAHAEHAEAGGAARARAVGQAGAKRIVSCGDHWFSVELSWTEGAAKGKVSFSGDSRSPRESQVVKVSEKAGTVVATFPEPEGGELTLTGTNGGELSGTMRDSAGSEPVSVNPCYWSK